MQSTKAIKRRLESVKSTRQLTKAMEMVSTVKMRLAINAMTENKPFAQKAWEIIGRVMNNLQQDQQLLQEIPFFQTNDQQSQILFILLTDDQGLCGGFHAKLFQEIKNKIKTDRLNKDELHFINIGRRGEQYLRKNEFRMMQNYAFREFAQTDGQTTVITPIIEFILNSFAAQEYRQIYLIHTDYINTFVQNAKTTQLLPFTYQAPAEQITVQTFDPKTHFMQNQEDLESSSPEDMAAPSLAAAQDSLNEYTIEPDIVSVLTQLIPFGLSAQLYQSLLESHASVETARITAMRNANKSADEIVDSLQLTYNQIRQNKITQDITEISAGKSALEDT